MRALLTGRGARYGGYWAGRPKGAKASGRRRNAAGNTTGKRPAALENEEAAGKRRPARGWSRTRGDGRIGGRDRCDWRARAHGGIVFGETTRRRHADGSRTRRHANGPRRTGQRRRAVPRLLLIPRLLLLLIPRSGCRPSGAVRSCWPAARPTHAGEPLGKRETRETACTRDRHSTARPVGPNTGTGRSGNNRPTGRRCVSSFPLPAKISEMDDGDWGKKINAHTHRRVRTPIQYNTCVHTITSSVHAPTAARRNPSPCARGVLGRVTSCFARILHGFFPRNDNTTRSADVVTADERGWPHCTCTRPRRHVRRRQRQLPRHGHGRFSVTVARTFSTHGFSIHSFSLLIIPLNRPFVSLQVICTEKETIVRIAAVLPIALSTRINYRQNMCATAQKTASLRCLKCFS